MHEMAVFWLRMATALYGVGLLHVMAIAELSVAIGHLPVASFFESATVCAFLIAVLFLFVYWRYDAASLSVCIFPLEFVLTQVGAMESPLSGWPSTNVRALLLVHVMMVLLGYASLLLTAVASRRSRRSTISSPTP